MTTMIKKLRKNIREKFIANFDKTKNLTMPVLYAQIWQLFYRVKNFAFAIKRKYGSVIGVVTLLSLIVLSGFFRPTLQNYLEPYFSVKEHFYGVQTLFVTLGGALIGATAIVFSFIMFAMQVNVERMPHGLFRKLSSDIKLLGSFAITFLFAIVIIYLSIIPDKSWVGVAILVSTWGTVLIIIFFLFAYRRALSLISPTKQLSFIVADTKKNFDAWVRASRRESFTGSSLES